MSATLAGRDLVQAALNCTDLPRSVGFYRDVLGLPLMFETNGMAFFQLGNCRLMIGRGESGSGGGCLYLDAPDLPSLGEALEGRGVVFLGPAETVQKTTGGDLKLRFFRDPDGNLLALMGVVA
ncbi:MAG TPA: VOC family protein [Caulobacteraceae bacterium]|nr:VOC family protein [Caulobacteraceae bacterium]